MEPDPVGSAWTRTTTSPASVNLTPFESRFNSTWRRRASSPRIPAGRGLVDQAAELDPLLPRAWRDDVQRSLHALTQAERLPFEVDFAGLDLRVVEYVVDHVQQRVSARPDDLGELALLVRQLRVEQEIGHPDHGVHRRPDLMAHRGQEGALGLRRRLGLLAGALELGDVVVDAEEADVGAVQVSGTSISSTWTTVPSRRRRG